MHALFFEIKTAYLSAQVVARRIAREIDLTPARFDRLFAISERGPFQGTRQDELRRKLHVSTSNVSRMVRALERLGWVERTRDREDRRTWRIRLTPRAEEMLGADGLLARKCLQKVVRKVVCGGKSVIDTMLSLEPLIYRVLALTGRPLDPLYPYGHPDD
jgi:DNA-binding MarR family transcriptional regulator